MTSSKPPWDDDLPPVTAYDGPQEPQSARAGDRLHTIHGYIIRETDKAILIEVQQVNETRLEDKEVPGGDRNMWFPLSLVSTIHRSKNSGNDYDYIRAKEWICKQKGLI